MKRNWGFGREKGMSPLGSASGLQRQGRGVGQKNNGIDNLLLGYHVQDRDLRKIHKAACVGNAAQVQQILFFAENGVDDRDKMNRTALHLACANGHPEVVSLLVERKCHLNLCDHENRTALMKAVQCQEEKCVNILLENGADPNIRDVSGNTALHYAAFGDNISIIEKLLLYNANTEARNKDNITPLLVAVNENKQQIVEVLVEKAANIHAEDKLKSYEIICRHKEEIMLKNSLQNSNPGSDEKAEEDSITRLSDTPVPDDSWSTSASQDLDFGTKSMSEKPNKYVPHVSGAVDQKGQSILSGQVEGSDEKAEEDSITRLSDKPGPDDSWPTSSSQVLHFGTKEGTAKSAMEAKGDGVGIIENVPPKQTVNDSLTSAGGVHKNYRSDIMSALELGEEEDVESPSLPEYQVPLKVDEKKKHRGSDIEVSENIHDAAAAGLIPQRQNGKTDNHQLPITENKDSDRREPGLHMKKLKKGENEKGTSKGSVITPVLQKADSLTGGPLQKNDGSHFSEKDQHESRPAKKISKKKNKVKKQITSMDDLVDFIQSSETASEHCELPYSKNFMLLIEQLGMDCKDYAGFLKIRDICVSYEKLRKLNKNHCKLLMGKMTEMDKVVSALQNELREAKDMISRLEHQKVEWEREFCSLRCTLKQEEEEERRNADMLYENIREKLRRKEDEYKKEVETKQQVELALRTLNMELKATKNQVVARQLQQELADTLKKQSMSEASPEVTSYLCLEDETRDLKKKLAQIRSQLQEEQERHGEAVRYAAEKKDHVQKLQVKNATQEATIKHQAAQIQYLESNVIKTSLADVLTTELETTSSKCLHMDAKNQVLQQELLSMKAFEEEREKLESNNKKLQQEVVKLKQFMEMNMVERGQVEQYKREIEERARLDIEEKLHEVNLFLQAQAAARENLDQVRENAHASTRSQMELRIKDLESQLSTMKMSQEDSTKTELETYRQLYLEELKVRKSLRNKLNRTNERLSESNTKLLVERQQHQTLLRTLTMSPGLEPPYCGHFENNLVLNGNLTPRGNLVIPTLNPRPSYDDRETSLWKTQRELEKRITRALEEAATKFE
ncbi:ankyrin repeat domain-containing protein 26-like [Neofelis nebulosa]|uniref:ankyrin repeat domain-containing protein 26-like n=1 Tax=Neofelis nebulosa TaxID=61452 RepID=UPI00272CED3B|nr:ankyrin repeat domain-containing protein 26-like [Neofelis nebulosa]